MSTNKRQTNSRTDKLRSIQEMIQSMIDSKPELSIQNYFPNRSNRVIKDGFILSPSVCSIRLSDQSEFRGANKAKDI